VLLCALHPSSALAQGTTAFTYQGQLSDTGTNANGAYAMIFNLYDAASGGDLIGGPITNSATLANGLFSVNLDFGAGAFNGAARWLDITVQCGTNCETLAPRVQVLPSPYALFAAVASNVTNGAITSAKLAANAVGSQNLAVDSNSLACVTGGAASMTNNQMIVGGTRVWTSTLSVNGSIQAGVGGFIFPDGTVQVSANNPAKGVTNFNQPGTYSFTVPFGVTQLYIEAWGGGGGGGTGDYQIELASDGSSYAAGTGGGGGGAGGYARGVINVSPLQTYTVQVGAGGAAGPWMPVDGVAQGGGDGGLTGFSTLSGISINLFACSGGAGGGAGTYALYDGTGGLGGQADPSAGIQIPGMSGSDGSGGDWGGVYYYGNGGAGGQGTLGTLQPPGIAYGYGGIGGYGNGADPYGDGFVAANGGWGGCIIIQW